MYRISSHSCFQVNKYFHQTILKNRKVSSFTLNLDPQDSTNWRIVSSVILERWPIITPSFEPWHIEYMKYLSWYNCGGSPGSVDLHQSIVPQRNCDKSFYDNPVCPIPSNRYTSDDIKKETHSYNRLLDQYLYLIIHKPNLQYSWNFPMGGLLSNDSLITSAKRNLEEEVGYDINIYFPSKAPCCFFEYYYTKQHQQRTNKLGAKVFYLKAIYVNGNIKIMNNKLIKDFAWIPKTEIQNYLKSDLTQTLYPALCRTYGKGSINLLPIQFMKPLSNQYNNPIEL